MSNMALTQEDLAAGGTTAQPSSIPARSYKPISQMSTSELNEAFDKLSSSQKVRLNDLGRLITFMDRNVAIMNKKQKRINSVLQSSAYDETIHEAVTAAQKRDEFFALAGQDELLTPAGKSFMRQAYVSGDEDKIAECYCMCTEMDQDDERKITVKAWMNMKLERKYLAFQGAVGKEGVQAAALAFRPKECEMGCGR